MLGSQVCAYTIVTSSARCWLLGWDNGVAFCLPGRFPSCLVTVGSTGGILKSACNHFLVGAVGSVFKARVGATSGSEAGASERLTASCLWVQ